MPSEIPPYPATTIREPPSPSSQGIIHAPLPPGPESAPTQPPPSPREGGAARPGAGRSRRRGRRGRQRADLRGPDGSHGVRGRDRSHRFLPSPLADRPSPLTEGEGGCIHLQQVPKAHTGPGGAARGGGRQGQEPLSRSLQVGGSSVQRDGRGEGEDEAEQGPMRLSIPASGGRTHRKTLPRPVPVKELAP